ncbi:class I SAM-dependent methyltransferase [Photobacterium sanguinicancri]|uniref:class I SAM-dependent methyltransferase n=1 Tax=Photobacterium sanguinicancri TaxID=875932 RepID=UPI0026E16A49|nr:SAM-dependent methyltransferase [Photobacterium sanguinicancri]MDO6499003.1 SAM-dependent methyltransferase [Photobacterium sanguinicancri]
MSNSFFRKDGTAQGVAKQRLIETLAEPDKRIINDPFAGMFVVGASIIKLMGHKISVWLTNKFAPGFHEHLISRTRFIDDLVKQSAASCVEQYVILGAGYDLRAHRLELPPSLRVFEVDQIEVQTRKRQKLPKDLPNAENVVYVDVNFMHQSLAEQLLAAGFDENKATVFTLEGVSQYISKEALAKTVREVAMLTRKTRSIFFISYVDKCLKTRPKACFGKGYPKAEERAKAIMSLSEKVGEPWVSLYSAQEIETLLLESGLIVKENKTLADLNTIYFEPSGRALLEKQIIKLEHFVIAESHST